MTAATTGTSAAPVPTVHTAPGSGSTDPSDPTGATTAFRSVAAVSVAAAAPERLDLRVGLELELLAPRGSSRARLAARLAAGHSGTVHRFWHTDAEPSLVPGMGHFITLTPGFEVRRADGGLLCRLVDDITLRADLDPQAAPRPGWYRILGDEPRIMRLTARLADPDADHARVLDEVARVFGGTTRSLGPVLAVDDPSGASVVMAAALPGERERPCEVITPPLEEDHARALEELLGPARALGFSVPQEAAVHLHVDAEPWRQVHAFTNLVRLFSDWRDPLRRALGTNPACRRLGALPTDLVALAHGSPAADWPSLRAVAAGTGVSKYADVNLTALLGLRRTQDTVEIRCLPGALDTGAVMARAHLVQRLLQRCQDRRPLPAPGAGAEIEDVLRD